MYYFLHTMLERYRWWMRTDAAAGVDGDGVVVSRLDEGDGEVWLYERSPSPSSSAALLLPNGA
jgi:hypothetical protein